MSTDMDHLKAFNAADGVPDPDARAAARVALLERIEDAAAQQLPAARPVREGVALRPRRLFAGGFGLAGAAALALALVSGLGSGGVQPSEATAAQLLRRAADVAAQGPDVVLQPGQYWYTRTASRQPGAEGGGIQTREDWFSSTGEARWVVHRPGQADEEHAFTEGHVVYGFFPKSLTYEQVLALPRDGDGLYEAIERAGAVWAAGDEDPPKDRTYEMFTIVGDWLRASPPLPASLRAGLFRVAARLPNVESLGTVRDERGREGIAVAQIRTSERRELVFDPDTAQLLMERTVRPSAGGLAYEALYLESGVVDSAREVPKP